MHRVLITDYAWPDLDIERAILREANAELVVATATDADSLAKLAADCDAIMTNWAKVPASVITACKNCKLVARLGIGLDNINVAHCTAHNIPVTNVPDYCLIEVAEHALALVLAQARKVAFYHHATKDGKYQLQAGPTLRRIEGQTLGIVGYGNIGRKLAEKALGIGLKVLATGRSKKELPAGAKWTSLEELLRESDYVSLHVPATPETKHLMNAERLSLMKPTAYLVNTARGGIVDHAALAAALDGGKLAGAALDVQETEPPDLSQPPYNHERCLVTPHAAFVSAESLENLRTRVAKQVAAVLRGQRPENIVNGL